MQVLTWLHKRMTGRPTPARKATTRFRPQLEVLEDRCVPSRVTNILEVTNTADSGTGSLRYEIAQAHSGDTIVFNFDTKQDKKANSTPHTITLTRGELVINKNLTIQGPAAILLTINSEPYYNDLFEQENGSRIFEVDGADTTVTVSGLTMSNGGGTVYRGDYGRPYDGYGGAILNFGTLTVSACELGPSPDASSNFQTYGNSADNGGAIANFGTMVVTGCTVSNNFATYEGGGVYNAGTAGALTVLDSNFSSNSPDNIYGSYTDGGGNTFN